MIFHDKRKYVWEIKWHMQRGTGKYQRNFVHRLQVEVRGSLGLWVTSGFPWCFCHGDTDTTTLTALSGKYTLAEDGVLYSLLIAF